MAKKVAKKSRLALFMKGLDKQENIGRVIDQTQQGVSKKIKSENFTYSELKKIFKAYAVDGETIAYLMGGN